MRRPSALVLAASLSLATAAGSARADEASLPRGWVPGAGVGELPASPQLGWGSFQANHVFTFRTRDLLPGARHDVAALPVVALEPTTVPEAPPRLLPEGPSPDVVVVRRGGLYRISLQGFGMGFVQVRGASPAAVGPRAEGGAVGKCGEVGVVPLSYEGVRRVDGAIELVWGRGFFDGTSCRAAILESHAARPQHLAGVVYAFRALCPACREEARDVLHVLMPQAGSPGSVWVPFEHHALALGPGRTAAIDAVVEGKGTWTGLPDWGQVIPWSCSRGRAFCRSKVRVEVSQARGEPEPTLLVSREP